MDNTVIILIGAGVSCVVIGFTLFVKLMKTGSTEYDEAAGDKKLLADDYAENFKECFENTGNIEETLEQLTDIYTGNQYMYNLIANAIDYIKEGQGDYETALDGINVDSDTNIMKMHNNAIKKALNLESPNENRKIKSDNKNSGNPFESEKDLSADYESQSTSKDFDESFDEDEKEEAEIEEANLVPSESKDTVEIENVASNTYEEGIDAQNDENGEYQESFDDDDLDDFKIG